MSFDDHARLPAPAAGSVSDHGEVHLQAADGNEFAAFYAYPVQRARIGVIVMPDVRGLHGFYQELAQRFAQVGMLGVAIDYYGRTADIGFRDDGFPYRDHAERLEPAQVDLDVVGRRGRYEARVSAGQARCTGHVNVSAPRSPVAVRVALWWVLGPKALDGPESHHKAGDGVRTDGADAASLLA